MQHPLTLRLAAFLSAGVLLVHEGRYRLAFGSDTETVLAARGHGYLPFVSVAVCGLMALAGGQWLRRLASGRQARQIGPDRLGAGLALAILAVFCGQELLEGALTAGHPVGLGTVLADGGWIAAPLAALVGAIGGRLLAAADRAVAHSVGSIAWSHVTVAERLWRPAVALLASACAPLARHLAGRGPPQRWN